jgi:hypothetical protein
LKSDEVFTVGVPHLGDLVQRIATRHLFQNKVSQPLETTFGADISAESTIHECIQNDNLFKVLQESLMIRPLFFPISETILFSWYLYIPVNIVWGSFCFSKSGTPFFSCVSQDI